MLSSSQNGRNHPHSSTGAGAWHMGNRAQQRLQRRCKRCVFWVEWDKVSGSAGEDRKNTVKIKEKKKKERKELFLMTQRSDSY